MDAIIRKEIEEISGKIKCSKDFRCVTNGFEQLCKARDVGLSRYLECLEANTTQCKFSSSLGYTNVCQCPLRIFIGKKLKK